MRKHRFYLQNIPEGERIEVSDSDLIHQIRKVLRLNEGDKVSLFNEEVEVEATISEVMKSSLVFSKENMKNVSRKNEKFILHPSMIKKDKMEYVLQKCTEIGVLYFSPIVSERTEKTNLNVKRAEQIVREAVEQSGQNHLPQIGSITPLSELSIDNETGDYYYLQMNGEKMDISNMVTQLQEGKEIHIFVGPEGGWGDQDVQYFNDNNVKPISIGETTLRAETASIAVSSLIMLNR